MRFLMFWVFILLILTIPNAYSQDCTIQDHCGDGVCGSSVETENCNTCPQDCGACCECSGGQVQYDGGCGQCGTLRRDCNGCNWGNWYCSNQGPCSPGQVESGGSCGNCGTLQRTCQGNCQWGGWNCINQGPCSPGSTQCSSDRYQVCSSSCQWQNSGTNADSDAKDLQCGDSLCDSSPNVYDSTKTATENACSDSLDNDCDLKTDCNDNDCDGSITGTVKNQENQSIAGADVSAKKDLTSIKSATTNHQGSYTISPINCGTYNLVTSHQDYAPQTRFNFVVDPQQQETANFGGPGESNYLVLGTSCEQDCTFASDNIIHASCDGKNSCTFYDSISKAACDNSQPGWLREYNSTHYITCASGSPQPNIEIKASVSCSSGTLVKVTRIVVYNGKPVKLVVAACG